MDHGLWIITVVDFKRLSLFFVGVFHAGRKLKLLSFVLFVGFVLFAVFVYTGDDGADGAADGAADGDAVHEDDGIPQF